MKKSSLYDNAILESVGVMEKWAEVGSFLQAQHNHPAFDIITVLQLLGGGFKRERVKMGAIGGEDLMKWEKIEGVANRNEEKILVLVRLRPLSEKDVARNEVSEWECINDTTVLFRNSLQERSMFPTAYTFDRVFGGDCSTRQVYEAGANGIALSVVSGINSSIFAYGQTSSGKTYTMIGITEYTVADIYDYMERHEERAFVLKFSAIEIYNEAVRDLLSTENMPLRLLDDLEKGTIVERLTEVIVRDWSHVKELLSVCEAQRKVGETSLNETSSRSHQILRLTIESSAREFIGKDKSTTLAASVNFVDLAGSERASQALSVGQRLKEGCHINRSLLTLSTVIRKLSKGRNGHVNYRDSKLTRILQPSLGGNARTAIICTLNPARDYVEQSKNTLLFASCAKEVSTDAQVNVVMSDKALVKHLQKEVARLESELRTPVPTSTCDNTALLRKKDMQIEKLEKEVRELTKQRDLAQSRIEELLHAVRSDQATSEWVEDGICHHPKCQRSTYEHECSVSESSGVVDSHCLEIGIKICKSTQVQDNGEVNSGSCRSGIVSGLCENSIDFDLRGDEDSVDNCRDVRCVETDGSNDNNALGVAISNRESQRRMLGLPNERNHFQNAFSFGELERRFHDVLQTINSLGTPCPDEEVPNMSTPGSFKLTRSRSCRPNLMTGSYSHEFEMVENTPPNSFMRNFPGRPDGPQRKTWNISPFSHGPSNAKLSRNDSESSIASTIVEGKSGQKNNISGDEDIPSVDNFVAGLKKMANLQYAYQGTGPMADKNVRDVGLDPMRPPPSDWPVEFKRQQRLILELWEACNVSLIHRTYFFLLFKGDPMDSIYMEVEVRRLSFLRETFSKGNPAVEDGRTLTLASSMKALRREREMLSRLMNKRFSDNERKITFQEWNINLDSKRRRMQLVNRIWSETEDAEHITDSASIVAKLIRFSEKGQALKEMFGLSFAPTRMTRRSLGWKRSMASLL